jgi:hypothetical protein
MLILISSCLVDVSDSSRKRNVRDRAELAIEQFNGSDNRSKLLEALRATGNIRQDEAIQQLPPAYERMYMANHQEQVDQLQPQAPFRYGFMVPENIGQEIRSSVASGQAHESTPSSPVVSLPVRTEMAKTLVAAKAIEHVADPVSEEGTHQLVPSATHDKVSPSTTDNSMLAFTRKTLNLVTGTLETLPYASPSLASLEMASNNKERDIEQHRLVAISAQLAIAMMENTYQLLAHATGTPVAFLPPIAQNTNGSDMTFIKSAMKAVNERLATIESNLAVRGHTASAALSAKVQQ